MLLSSSATAAVSTVGYDLFQTNSAATITAGQTITVAALRGSAAAGDTEIRLLAGNTEIAQIFSAGTGVPTGTDMLPVGYRHMGASVRLFAQIVDAPTTNPVYLVVTKI